MEQLLGVDEWAGSLAGADHAHNRMALQAAAITCIAGMMSEITARPQVRGAGLEFLQIASCLEHSRLQRGL
jgi:hypothetical protein